MLGIIEAIDIEAGLRQQMRVTPLSTWYVKNARAGWKSQDLYESRDFVPVALRREDRLILEQIVRIKI